MSRRSRHSKPSKRSTIVLVCIAVAAVVASVAFLFVVELASVRSDIPPAKSCKSQVTEYLSSPVARELRLLPNRNAARMLWALRPPACFVNAWRWQKTMKAVANHTHLSAKEKSLLRRIQRLEGSAS